jgi:DNA processing protein
LNELNEDKKKYQIALSLIEGVGDLIGKKLLAFTGSAKAVFFAKQSELEKIEGIGKVLVKAILSNDLLARAEGQSKNYNG